MTNYIRDNAQAVSLRANHGPAYFITVGAMAMAHVLAVYLSVAFLVLILLTVATMIGAFPVHVGLAAILAVCIIAFIVVVIMLFAASKQVHRLLSAIRTSDLSEIKAARIFSIATKAVRQ